MPSPGVAIMLMDIEEIIALNYNLFSRAEIDNLPKLLAHLREIAELQRGLPKGSMGNPRLRTRNIVRAIASKAAKSSKPRRDN